MNVPEVVLVTGASRGIGRAVAVELAKLGGTVVLACRTSSPVADAALEEVRSAGAASAFLVTGDLGVPAEATRVVCDAAERAGGLDVLVNNAAIQRSSMAHTMRDEDWHDVIGVNLSSVFFTCRAALQLMRPRRRGHIINVASASSYVAHPGACSYVASKHGLIGLTKALAVENASHGVLVNAIAPGLTHTDMTAALSGAQRERLLGTVPLGRMAEAGEQASLVRWLVTEATYSTGNVFHASGGVAMG